MSPRAKIDDETKYTAKKMIEKMKNKKPPFSNIPEALVNLSSIIHNRNYFPKSEAELYRDAVDHIQSLNLALHHDLRTRRKDAQIFLSLKMKCGQSSSGRSDLKDTQEKLTTSDQMVEKQHNVVEDNSFPVLTQTTQNMEAKETFSERSPSDESGYGSPEATDTNFSEDTAKVNIEKGLDTFEHVGNGNVTVSKSPLDCNLDEKTDKKIFLSYKDCFMGKSQSPDRMPEDAGDTMKTTEKDYDWIHQINNSSFAENYLTKKIEQEFKHEFGNVTDYEYSVIEEAVIGDLDEISYEVQVL